MPRRLAAAALGLLVLLATGCTAQRYWGGDAAADGEAKIGLVTKTDTNPYFVGLRRAAERAVQERGAEFSALAGQFDGDNDGQVRAIENLLQQDVSTILITPNSSTGVLDAIDRARQSGVLVIALDTATEPAEAVDATFATDNHEAGRQQGAYVRAALGEQRAQLLMLDGTAGSSVDTYRHEGFLDGMGIREGSRQIRGGQNVNGDQNLAQQGLENLLARTPGINAIYTMNEPTARGAHTALRSRGIADEVIMASIDGGCEGVRDVAEGRLDATVMQFPAKMAELAVDAAVRHAETGEQPRGFTGTGSVVVTDDPVPGVPSESVSWGRQHCWGDR